MCRPLSIHVTVLLALVLPFTLAIGGIAELKAITGDMPYFGMGNQEVAGEVYIGRGSMPYGNYLYNQPYGQQGMAGSPYANYLNPYNSPPAGPVDPAAAGRFYSGGGNAFINRH
ncbi:hypothetical protein L596_006058 [Steinernema carpocapsae]|uniref:Uncharacterized protein n=1 Tax=Steinernema carpocapsae TaxID=34508 RepID=A0A4U8V178_STECR|nr:hypothetical protein L596_006058 [Steinernema carpocapsae]